MVLTGEGETVPGISPERPGWLYHIVAQSVDSTMFSAVASEESELGLKKKIS